MTENDVGMIGETAKAVVKEYNKSKRKSLYIKFALFIVVAVILFSLASKSKPSAMPVDDHVAAIRIEGVIMNGEAASMDSLYSGIKEAFENDKVKAVMLLINSPGGSPGVSEPIYQEILYRKALHNKPVVAVCDFMCASAAYEIAVAADEIYANDESVVGSIGAFIQNFEFTETVKHLKVKPRFYGSGENKGLLNPFLTMSTEQDKFIQTFVEKSHKKFIQKVVEQRGERLTASARSNPTSTHDIFSGKFFHADEALEYGLIDGIGYTQSIVRERFPEMELLDYTPKPNLEDILAEVFSTSHQKSLFAKLQYGLGF